MESAKTKFPIMTEQPTTREENFCDLKWQTYQLHLGKKRYTKKMIHTSKI